MKKNWFALILAGAMAFSMTACGGSSGTATTAGGGDTAAKEESAAAADQGDQAVGEGIEKPSSPLRYSLGTSSSGGNFYLVGGGIATILNNSLPDYFVITSEETGGSTANLTMIQNGEMEVGIAMTSSLAEAKEGTAEWTGGPMDKVRGMVALYPSYMMMYALSSSGIKNISDFNGKIVGLGSKGAAMDSVLRTAFDKMGVKPASIYNDGHGATASAVADGQVDAAVLFSFPPFAAISELEATQELTFIGLTPEEQKQLTDMYPFYTAATMPAGSYKGATEDVPTVTEWNMLVCSSEVPEDYIYLMTKTLLENNPQLMEIHKSLEYCTAENILNYNVPLHAGTVRYLQEVGVNVPDELIPPEYQK